MVQQPERRPLAIFLMGPTASGKTDLAVELAQRLPLEIISVDSALVYRGMDIGTAKPSARILKMVPHRLIDICAPTETYSAARFRRDALAAMQDISERGRIPLLVGGTMLYFRALEQGLADLPAADPELRRQLQDEMRERGLMALHARLRRLDPVTAARIDANDPQRILRALEVYTLTGKPLSDLLAAGQGRGMPYRALKLIRSPGERSVLHERIARRFDAMLEQGFEQEVRGLMKLPGFTPALPSMRSVGYRQMIAHLHGECDQKQMRERAIVATRQLAKRQLTWLRKETKACWIPDEPGGSVPDLQRTIERELE